MTHDARVAGTVPSVLEEGATEAVLGARFRWRRRRGIWSRESEGRKTVRKRRRPGMRSAAGVAHRNEGGGRGGREEFADYY